MDDDCSIMLKNNFGCVYYECLNKLHDHKIKHDLLRYIKRCISICFCETFQKLNGVRRCGSGIFLFEERNCNFLYSSLLMYAWKMNQSAEAKRKRKIQIVGLLSSTLSYNSYVLFHWIERLYFRIWKLCVKSLSNFHVTFKMIISHEFDIHYQLMLLTVRK